MKKNIPVGLPWYRYPFVWLFLIIIPCMALAGCAVLIYMAITSKQSGVIESYQKRGMNADQVAPMESYAERLDLKARLTLSSNQMVITFNQLINESETLEILFRHPTIEKSDFRLPLERISEQQYSAPIPENLQTTHWDIIVEGHQNSQKTNQTQSANTPATAGWRIRNRLLPSEQSVLLTPFGHES